MPGADPLRPQRRGRPVRRGGAPPLARRNGKPIAGATLAVGAVRHAGRFHRLRSAMEMFRQGDILLVATDSLPADAVDIMPLGQRIYLAPSRKTGQSHGVPASAARLFATYRMPFDSGRPGERFLKILSACVLEHNQHDPIPLAPGFYRIIQQRRYDSSGWLDVAD